MSTAVVCGECGKGNFAATGDYFVCTVCASEVTWADILPNVSDDADCFVFQGLMRVSDPS